MHLYIIVRRLHAAPASGDTQCAFARAAAVPGGQSGAGIVHGRRLRGLLAGDPTRYVQMNEVSAVRIDKWLWAARFFKTRTLASDAVENGKVRVGEERVKPARNIKPGEILQIDNGASQWEVTVQALSDKRGSAPQAQLLYRETEAGVAQRARVAEERRYYREPGTTLHGRPTKRDRRLIDKSTG